MDALLVAATDALTAVHWVEQMAGEMDMTMVVLSVGVKVVQ